MAKLTQKTAMTQEQGEIALQKQQLRDEALRVYCNKKEIHLIEIDGRQFSYKKLEKYITNLLKGEING